MILPPLSVRKRPLTTRRHQGIFVEHKNKTIFKILRTLTVRFMWISKTLLRYVFTEFWKYCRYIHLMKSTNYCKYFQVLHVFLTLPLNGTFIKLCPLHANPPPLLCFRIVHKLYNKELKRTVTWYFIYIYEKDKITSTEMISRSLIRLISPFHLFDSSYTETSSFTSSNRLVHEFAWKSCSRAPALHFKTVFVWKSVFCYRFSFLVLSLY